MAQNRRYVPSPAGYFAEFGFSQNKALGTLPGPSATWSLVEGNELSPGSPVTLEFVNEKGITFRRTITLDENFMFDVADTITNGSGETVTLQPYGRLARFGEPETAGIYVLHEGLIGAVGDQGLDEIDYDDIQEEGLIQRNPASSGWLHGCDRIMDGRIRRQFGKSSVSH